jgi:hypothetical protein
MIAAGTAVSSHNITLIQANWKDTYYKCYEQTKDKPQMRGPGFWVGWGDVDFKDYNIGLSESIVAQAVIAVTSTTNLPVSYAFGNGKAGTICDDTVELFFPAGSPALHLSATNESAFYLSNKLSNDVDRWPAYIIHPVSTWIKNSSVTWDTFSTLSSQNVAEHSANYDMRWNASIAITAIHVLTGKAPQIAYSQADMEAVLAQVGNIPIMAFPNSDASIWESIWGDGGLPQLPYAVFSMDPEAKTYDFVDRTTHPPERFTYGNITDIVESCWALVSLDPTLGVTWQDITMPW